MAATVLLGALGGCSDIVDPVMSDGGFTHVAAGDWHTCGLTAVGTVYCWGRGDSGQLDGNAGGSTAYPRLAAAAVRFTDISAGAAHTCGVTTDQQVYCWGSNADGQLGRGGTSAHDVPQPVAGGSRFMAVSAGAAHTCALDIARDVHCWGANGRGQAGGAGGIVVAPRRLTAPGNIAVLSAGGFHTCAVDAAGVAWCWGANDVGQLGDGTGVGRNLPAVVAGGARFTTIGAGFAHNCGVTVQHIVLCWGSSEHGELGFGGTAPPGVAGSTTPIQILLPQLFDGVAGGHYMSCAVQLDTSAWCWGRGGYGQLGNGFIADAYTPQPVLDGVPNGPTFHFGAVAAGVEHACGLSREGAIYCWGRGGYGQLGAGSITTSPLAIRVVAPR